MSDFFLSENVLLFSWVVKFLIYLNRRVFVMTASACLSGPLRKHAYSNILKISPPKNRKFSDKKNLFFIFLLKT